MGATIYSFAEIQKDNKWVLVEEPLFGVNKKTTEPFGWRSYSIFGFLADVRNYSDCTPISQPKGLPKDSEHLNKSSNGLMTLKDEIENEPDLNSLSFLTLKELTEFNYENTLIDKRNPTETSLGHWTEGEEITYRNFLGEEFFIDLKALQQLGEPEAVRIVFWFND